MPRVADLSLSSAQGLLRSAARDFIERECPLSTVRTIDEGEDGFSRELWQQIAGLGWPGLLVPSEYGGAGGSLTDAAVLCEEMGRGLLPSPYHSSAILGALLLLRSGSAEQKERLLPDVARGEQILTLAVTEPNYGWGPEHVQMSGAASGRSLILDGVKQFVPDAGSADQLICVARTRLGSDPVDGLTVCLVGSRAAGVQRRAMPGFVGEPLYEVAFEGVEVPADSIIGAIHQGWGLLTSVLDIGTALLCAYIAGAGRRVYELTMEYAQRRIQFGQPIARFQRVQDHLIEMLNHADAARWTAYEAIWKLEAGMPNAAEAVSVAKAASSEGFYQLCEDAHHVHAGIGSDKAYGLYLYTKRSRSLYHYLGDPAFHRRRLAKLLRL